MGNPWDKDDGTVVIKNEEVTEQWDVKSHLTPKKAVPKTTTRTPPSKPGAVDPTPPGGTLGGDVGQAIDDTIDHLDNPKSDLTELLEASEITSPRGINIGTILMSMSKLTQAQLDDAVATRNQESNTGELLGEILLRKKFVTEDELLTALSLQLNIPVAPKLSSEHIDAELVTKIPINFAKKHGIVPIRKKGDSVIVAISNATDLSPLDDIRIILLADVRPILAKKSEILDAINRIYDRATQPHDELIEDLEEQGLSEIDMPETQDLLDSEDEAPIIRLVNSLLFRAVKERASDIHIEPYEKDLSVRFRIDGVLYEIMKPPKKAQASISSRIKIMAQLDIAEKRIPQDGRIKIKIAGRDVDIRVSTLPTSHGESIVMRLLDTSHVILNLEQIGFSEKQMGIINQIVNKSHGIFLVTGPTGSGKTTTLYSCLSKINSKELKIITVEDPVEIQLQGIAQIQVNTKVNLTFASGLRSILRQDPDVIMVGEIRDQETAEIAIQASLTGHLVFSTLHTNDAASAITRLVDMGVEPFLVSSSLIAIMAQRLVREVCKVCREPYRPTPQELKELGIAPEIAARATIFRPRGCPTCYNTGYLGRTGIYEILPIDDMFRGLILKSADGTTLKKAAAAKGVKNLRDDGADKVLRGITTVEEVLRVTQEDMAME